MVESYNKWKEHLEGTADGKTLVAMTQDEIADAFSGNIAFGTGGLRGVMGLGTNRLNLYTVRRVTQGLAKTILSNEFPKSVCVAYDTRFNSDIFAQEVCNVFSSFGIAVYMFDKPVPTPALSFAIRHLKLGWGVAITASHNPQEYNGYKVYNHQGVQVTDQTASEITKSIESVEFFEPLPGNNNAHITTLGAELMDAYLNDIVSYVNNNQHSQDKLELPPDNISKQTDYPFVYSALHGAGAYAVPDVLKRLGYSPICIQQEPDGAFGGLKTPNPEEPVVYEKAINAAEENKAKMLLATDPDCDRVGVLIKTDRSEADSKAKISKSKEFETLNGNQIGALLIDYLAETHGVQPGDTVITTIVSGLLGELISKKHGLEFKRLLTGFKYIGEYAEQLPKGKQFFFGYEESYGFLAGDGARDKDAVIATALIVKMADRYGQSRKTLLERWEELSEEHGYCLEDLHSANVPQNKQKEIMTKLRTGINIEDLTKTEDYLQGYNNLPTADVLKLVFEDKSWAAIRPSGTEPKIKLYTGTTAETKEKAKTSLKKLTETLLEIMRV